VVDIVSRLTGVGLAVGRFRHWGFGVGAMILHASAASGLVALEPILLEERIDRTSHVLLARATSIVAAG
jgi:hypothetical protein